MHKRGLIAALLVILVGCNADTELPQSEDKMNRPNFPIPPFMGETVFAPGGGNVPKPIDYEAYQVKLLEPVIPIASQSAPLVIYRTKKQWRAIDVYISSDFLGNGGLSFLTVGIYTVSRGVRTLVRTGKFRGSGTGLTPFSFRVAAFRAQAETYEIVIQKNSNGFVTTMSADVSIVASDEANEPKDELNGVIQVTGNAPGLTLAVKGIGTSEGEIPITPVAIHGVNTVAAVRYIQIAATAATATLASFMIPASDSIVVTDQQLLGLLALTGTMVFRASSTPYVYTAAADVEFNAFVR